MAAAGPRPGAWTLRHFALNLAGRHAAYARPVFLRIKREIEVTVTSNSGRTT